MPLHRHLVRHSMRMPQKPCNLIPVRTCRTAADVRQTLVSFSCWLSAIGRPCKCRWSRAVTCMVWGRSACWTIAYSSKSTMPMTICWVRSYARVRGVWALVRVCIVLKPWVRPHIPVGWYVAGRSPIIPVLCFGSERGLLGRSRG